jgi:hypothetical protein
MATNPYLARAQSLQDDSWKKKDEAKNSLQIAPLTQAISAERQKLIAFMDDKGNVIPAHKEEYDATVKNMGDMIGRMRVMLGQKAPNEEPNHFESTIAGLTDKLHITRDLAHQLKTKQQQKAGQYQAQTQQMEQDTATGVLPYAMTPEGQQQAGKTAGELTVEQQKAKDASGLESQKAKSALDVANVRLDAKVPKGLKPISGPGEVPVGVQNEDTGKQYLPSQLEEKGDAPPEAKEMWKTIQNAQEQKKIEQEKRDERANRAISDHESNMGTWTVAEGDNGETKLLNSKTGEMKEAPSGLHKSGYYAKQIAPLEAANMNIDTYIGGKVFDGPGDLALQHEFFTATQPSTGFRMTKVQQDILQNSQSWLNSWKAKAYHAVHGTWFSDEQRQQIANAAKGAIEAKKKSLSGGGPKTEQLRQTQSSGAASDDDIIKALSGAK